jgi:hypothetical protein
VTVSIPVAAPATAEPAPPEPPQEKADVAIAGTWEEEFEGRSGCSDSVTIRGPRRALVMDGRDCNDAAHYEFSDVKYDGTTLWFTLTVPETRYVLRYSMRRGPDGTMVGQAQIGGSGPEETHTIRWTRPKP